jgi:Holliday junction resolvase RusA-like endonuclease
MPRYYHDTANADIDNCFKAVADALNGIAYNDDGQIAKISATKWRGEGKEEPHTRILIRELTDGESQHPRDESA